jgi:hypothetical protein
MKPRTAWIHYKFTTKRGATYEKNITVRSQRLADLVIDSPAMALKVISEESMPNLKTLHVFACGEGDSPIQK